MLDVVFPVSPANVVPACRSLQTLIETADLPLRIHTIFDGGERSAFAALEAQVRGISGEWRITHEEDGIGLKGCFRIGIQEARHPLSVLMAPWIEIEDGQWCGKMQQVFLKDQRAGACFTMANTPSKTAAPRRCHRLTASFATDLIMARTGFLKECMFAGDSLAEALVATANAQGCTLWESPGVRYYFLSHTVHKWHARSESLAPSESPSLMTPDSSTPTTTEADGPPDFEV